MFGQPLRERRTTFLKVKLIAQTMIGEFTMSEVGYLDEASNAADENWRSQGLV